MTLESVIQELVAEQRNTNRLLATLLAHAEGDRETLDRLAKEQATTTALRPGTKLYGFCGGAFGRDSYSDKTIERVEFDGRLRVYARDEDGVRHEADFDDWDEAGWLVEHTTMPEDHPDHPDYDNWYATEQREREAWEARQKAAQRPTPEERAERLRAANVPLPYDHGKQVAAREAEVPIEERVQQGFAAL